MRKRLWQLHSWVGLIFGLGLLVIGVTGSLLMFREEIEALVHPELVRVEPPTDAGRLSADALLESAERQLAGDGYEVTGWLYQYEKPHLADVLYTIKHGTNEWLLATMNPYTGELLASPRQPNATVHGWLLDLHYTFFADHTGMMITGVFAVALCLLGVTGVWLYREFWKNFFTLRWGRSARIFFSDLHKMIGISSVVFNLLLGFTGAYWNFTHVIGEWLAGEHEQAKLPGRLYADTLSLDALFADAAQRLPGFRANYVSFPWEAGGGFTLWGAVEPRGLLRGPYGSTVSYDAQKGEFQSLLDLRTAGWWQQCVDAFTPLHFGTFGGLPVKILWCLLGLAPGALAVSGFIIWRQRRKKNTGTAPLRTREGVAAAR